MTKDHTDLKRMFLFMAEGLSGNFSSVGLSLKEEAVFLDNSRSDILEKILNTFSNIGFWGNKVFIYDIPVSEAKCRLNLIAAFVSGRYGIIGPLSFTLEETDACMIYSRREVKVIEVRSGAVSVDVLSVLFTKFLEEEGKINNLYINQLREMKVFAQEA